MSSLELQETLIEAVCGMEDAEAIRVIDEALAAGADFVSDGIEAGGPGPDSDACHGSPESSVGDP